MRYFVAARHFAQFSELLRQQIAGGETNAAICERLGIARIYPTRKDFQTEYPLLKVAQSASPDWRFRMVAKSLFLVLTRGADVREAVKKGAKVVLCYIASARPSPALSTAGLAASDTEAAPARFRHDFGTCLTDANPIRSVYIRYHSVDLFDCYFTFHHAGADLTMWDISFGADSENKRTFLLDSTKGLGVDLERRYPSI